LNNGNFFVYLIDFGLHPQNRSKNFLYYSPDARKSGFSTE
jgi:hypothetical protein